MRTPALLAPALLLLVSSPLRSMAWPGGGGTAKRASQAVEASVEHSSGLQEPALTLPSNPSCFYRALSSLPSSTSSSSSSACDTLAHSDRLRTELAARMAMCEIGTSEGAKMPRECEDWERGTKRGKVASCVEALSRSPQHWSSYSGYLREIVTLCSAFRRWADVELARDLHGSTARTFTAFVDELRDAGLGDLVEKLKQEVEEATSEMRVALRQGVTEHEANLAALAEVAQDRLTSSLDLISARQAALAGGLHDLVSTAHSAEVALRQVNSAVLDLQPATEALSSSLTGSLSTASLLETQLSTVTTANLAQAGHLGAVLANLTLLAEQQHGGLLGGVSSRYDAAMGWEELVWLVQVVLGPARNFFGWPSILGALGTLYLLSPGWGGLDWSTVLGIVFVLSALIVFGGGTSPTLIAHAC
ncbi:hypothetical protein JCM8097_001760 [Rhodosporidiobolus ruineniae]